MHGAKEITIIPALEKVRQTRLAAYVRVSSKSPEQLTSYLAQIEYYKHYAENIDGVTLVDIYAEQKSGRDATNRDEFQRLMEDARAGKFDRVLIKSATRFARNIVDYLKYLRELKSLGISVFFEEEGIDTGEISSELLVSLFGVIAQERSRDLSENMRMSVRKRMKEGLFIGSYLSYGYTRNSKTKEIEIKNDEAAIVKFIFKKYINGHSVKDIADILNKLKIPTRIGKRWYDATIRYILKNERYIGDALLLKRIKSDTIPPTMIPNNEITEKVYIENNHPAIITRKDFQIAQKILVSKNINKSHRKKYPYTRKIECSYCGHFYTQQKNRGKVYWICNTKKNLSKVCESNSILEYEIDNAFIFLVNNLWEHCKDIIEPALEQIEYSLNLTNRNRDKIALIDKKLADLGDKLKIIQELKTNMLIEPNEYLIQFQKFNDEAMKLRSERLLLLKKYSHGNILDELQLLSTILKNMEYPQEKFDQNLFDHIVKKIIAGPNRLTFVLLGGIKFDEKINRGWRL